MKNRREWIHQSATLLGGGLLVGSCNTEPSSLDSDASRNHSGDNVNDPPGVPSPSQAAAFHLSPREAVISIVTAEPALISLTLNGESTERHFGFHTQGPNAAAASLAVSDLLPDTRYTVAVGTNGNPVNLALSFRTPPSIKNAEPVRFAYSADFDLLPENASAIVSQIVLAQPDFFVSLGDFPYCDNSPAAKNLDEYFAKHAEARLSPQLRPLFAAMPVYSIYDDHEFGNDFDAVFREDQPERVAAALSAWDAFFPAKPSEIPNRRYRHWQWGSHVECFLLDTRLYRSANDVSDDDAKTMLGAQQKAWLFAALAQSTATWKFVFSSVSFAPSVGLHDSWTGFAHERDELFALISETPISNVIFFCGDRHYFAARFIANQFHEYQAGPLARPPRVAPSNAPEDIASASVFNFGLVEVTADGTLHFTAISESGELLYQARHEPTT